MQVNIKRIDTSLPLPEYHTKGSLAFDIYAREEITIAPKTLALIPSNLIIKTPAGYGLIVAARSSLARKKGLMLANGIGIIDMDYSGNTDEILIAVHNFTDAPVTVEKAERIAQGMFVRIDQCTWNEVDEMTDKSRGGFGSTG